MGAATGATTSRETLTSHKAEDANDEPGPGPGPYDKHMKEAKEKRGHEIEEDSTNLDEKANTQDKRSDSTEPQSNERNQAPEEETRTIDSRGITPLQGTEIATQEEVRELL